LLPMSPQMSPCWVLLRIRNSDETFPARDLTPPTACPASTSPGSSPDPQQCSRLITGKRVGFLNQ
jgi:hypothetical protein